MNATPALAGALDAADTAVNGPRGFPADWDQIDWDRAEEDVRRLRQRIFAATRAGT